jgi:hypothetical protein
MQLKQFFTDLFTKSKKQIINFVLQIFYQYEQILFVSLFPLRAVLDSMGTKVCVL